MKLYKKSYGEWSEQRVDLWGTRAWVAVTYVPSAVREAARAYSSCRVEYDCGDAVVLDAPPQGALRAALEAAEAFEHAERRARRDAERLEAERDALRYARRHRHDAAIVGGVVLGELLAGLIRRK